MHSGGFLRNLTRCWIFFRRDKNSYFFLLLFSLMQLMIFLVVNCFIIIFLLSCFLSYHYMIKIKNSFIPSFMHSKQGGGVSILYGYQCPLWCQEGLIWHLLKSGESKRQWIYLFLGGHWQAHITHFYRTRDLKDDLKILFWNWMKKRSHFVKPPLSERRFY